jgi:hypothetical protein
MNAKVQIELQRHEVYLLATEPSSADVSELVHRYLAFLNDTIVAVEIVGIE